jgi:hypothetical protein
MTMRYVVYLRVSTDQQADTGQGLDIQEAACRKWLRRAATGSWRSAATPAAPGRSTSGTGPAWPARWPSSGPTGPTESSCTAWTGSPATWSCRSSCWPSSTAAARSCSSVDLTENASLLALPRRPDPRPGAPDARVDRAVRARGDPAAADGRPARKKLDGGYAGGAPPYGWAAVRGELVKVPASSAIRLMRRLRAGREVLPADRRRARAPRHPAPGHRTAEMAPRHHPRHSRCAKNCAGARKNGGPLPRACGGERLANS